MQKNSLNSPVATWPGRDEVIEALGRAAGELRARRDDVVAIGYFGSLANSATYGFGSDADVIVVVRDTTLPATHRLLNYDLAPLPVPADVLVYTEAELGAIRARGDRFAGELQNVIWL